MTTRTAWCTTCELLCQPLHDAVHQAMRASAIVAAVPHRGALEPQMQGINVIPIIKSQCRQTWKQFQDHLSYCKDAVCKSLHLHLHIGLATGWPSGAYHLRTSLQRSRARQNLRQVIEHS